MIGLPVGSIPQTGLKLAKIKSRPKFNTLFDDRK